MADSSNSISPTLTHIFRSIYSGIIYKSKFLILNNVDIAIPGLEGLNCKVSVVWMVFVHDQFPPYVSGPERGWPTAMTGLPLILGTIKALSKLWP